MKSQLMATKLNECIKTAPTGSKLYPLSLFFVFLSVQSFSFRLASSTASKRDDNLHVLKIVILEKKRWQNCYVVRHVAAENKRRSKKSVSLFSTLPLCWCCVEKKLVITQFCSTSTESESRKTTINLLKSPKKNIKT